ncbi:unnamed protein product [Ectocarpus sp. 4 AP-2014]
MYLLAHGGTRGEQDTCPNSARPSLKIQQDGRAWHNILRRVCPHPRLLCLCDQSDVSLDVWVVVPSGVALSFHQSIHTRCRRDELLCDLTPVRSNMCCTTSIHRDEHTPPLVRLAIFCFFPSNRGCCVI